MKKSGIFAVSSILWVIVALWISRGCSYVIWKIFPALWLRSAFNNVGTFSAGVYVVMVFFIAGLLCTLPGATWLAFLLPIPFMLRYIFPFGVSLTTFALCAYLPIIVAAFFFRTPKR